MLFIRRLVCLLPVVGLMLGTSCTLRETRQEGAVNLEPRFRVRAIEAASLGALDVLPLHQPADVDLPRRNQLITGYVNHDLPLKMSLKLSAYNPNLEETAITGLDYTVLVDGKVLGAGRLAANVELPARDSVIIPLSFALNTYKLLGNDAMPALRNFALGFGELHRERVTLRIRPTMRTPRGRLSSLVRRRPATSTATAEARPAPKRAPNL